MRTSRVVLFSLGVAVSFVAASAHAERPGRAVVIVVEGENHDAVASEIASKVEAPNHLEPARAFRAALAARGSRALAPAATSPAQSKQLIARAHAASLETHVDVAILVSVRKSKRGPLVHLWVIDKDSSGAAVNKNLTLGRGANASEEADAVWAASAGLLAPPAEAAPAPVAEKHGTKPDEEGGSGTSSAGNEKPPSAEEGAPAAPVAPRESDRGGALLILQANGGAGTRHFSYSNRTTPTLRTYDLGAVPLVSAAVEVYPLARSGLAGIDDFAITGDYGLAVGLNSADTAGTHVDTKWQQYDLGARERLRVGPHLIVGVNLGYGATDFTFSPATFPNAQLPSAQYRFLRGGLDLRGTFGAFAVYAGGSYLDVLSTGFVGTLFPHESVGAIDARAGAAYTIGGHAELSLGIDYTRFFYTLHASPTDMYGAGGATDEMTFFSLGFAYLL